jgi:hypothetical protein
MMPWVHMHAFPDGRAYPCCLADYWHPVGDLRKNTMEKYGINSHIAPCGKHVRTINQARNVLSAMNKKQTVFLACVMMPIAIMDITC